MKSWYVDVALHLVESELRFLRTEVYRREVDLECRELTAVCTENSNPDVMMVKPTEDPV